MGNFFNLTNCKLNEFYTLKGLSKNLDIKTKTRLLELGFIEGEKIKVLNKSIKGGVYLIEIRSSVLTLRKQECFCLEIE